MNYGAKCDLHPVSSPRLSQRKQDIEFLKSAPVIVTWDFFEFIFELVERWTYISLCASEPTAMLGTACQQYPVTRFTGIHL
jgi:hypothetical protein